MRCSSKHRIQKIRRRTDESTVEDSTSAYGYEDSQLEVAVQLSVALTESVSTRGKASASGASGVAQKPFEVALVEDLDVRGERLNGSSAEEGVPSKAAACVRQLLKLFGGATIVEAFSKKYFNLSN